MCDHENRSWLAGRGYQAKWRCKDCGSRVRGGYDHDEGRFIEFRGGTWP
ncbi:putative CxxC motif protein [Halophage HF1]|uniref:CxxC motif protein n=2 Tax=Haloferacalesvirus TaxID=2843389 RepID=A0A6B9PAE4_9CAUD|nr:putative CxxC motif protein [Halorubrum phage HF2]YP_009725274.1 putative CxxC motif protein [Halophage HF1]QHD55898.1 putative CxxC motif protein [Halorubrum phage HF2]QHD55939.1 putative CxxC motif protein [Halophage HF1]QIR31149.1 putative CxxC motif protein [Halorubrum virus Hardycor2]